MDITHAQTTAGSSARPTSPVPSPFIDPVTPVGSTPYGSRPGSKPGSTSAFSTPGSNIPQRYFHSRRVKPGEVQQPWKEKRDPKEKWVTIIPCIGLVVGLAVAGFLVWHGISSVVNHKYCPVLTEDWSNGFDEKIWTREVECGGFGYDLAPTHAYRDQLLTEKNIKNTGTDNSTILPTARKTPTSKMAFCTFAQPSRMRN